MTHRPSGTHRQDLLVYIDGLAIPCIRAGVRSGRWALPEATIDLVAHASIAGIGRDDHVPVVIFEYDQESPRNGSGATDFKDLDPNVAFPVYGEWKLAFDGFITGQQRLNQGEGNILRLQAVSDAGMLLTWILKYSVGYDDLYKVLGQQTASARGRARVDAKGKTLRRDWDLYYPQTLFFKNGLPPKVKKTPVEKKEPPPLAETSTAEETLAYLRDTPPQATAELQAVGTGAAGNRVGPGAYVNRPYDILANLFRVCDQGHQRQYRSIIVGRYFWPRLYRTRLMNRILPSPIFEQPIDPTYRGTAYAGVFECLKAVGARFKTEAQGTYVRQKALEGVVDMMAQTGGGSPAWSFFQSLYSRMVYDVLSIPNPALVMANDKQGRRQVLCLHDPNKPRIINVYPMILGNHTTLPSSFMGVPPRCNVIFPCMKLNEAGQEDFQGQPTRVYLGSIHATRNGLLREKGTPLTVGYPEEVFELLRISRAPAKAYLNNYNLLTHPWEYHGGPRAAVLGMPEWWHHLQDKYVKPQEPPEVTAPADEEEREAGTIEWCAAAPAADAELQAKSVKRRGLPVSLTLDPFFYAYARAVFYMERYGRRTLQLNIRDNRNLVAGLPCLVLDDEQSGVHQYGYITEIQREFHGDSRSMSVSIAYTRDMTETVTSIGDLQDDHLFKRGSPRELLADAHWYKHYPNQGLPAFNQRAAEYKERPIFLHELQTGQPDPVPSSAFITGIPEWASNFYAALLWGGTGSRRTWLTGCDVPLSPEGRGTLELGKSFAASTQSLFTLSTATGSELEFDPRRVEHRDIYLGDYQLRFREELKSEAFDPVHRTDDALTYTWRPICSLAQYLGFFRTTWETLFGSVPEYTKELVSINDPEKNVAASYPRYLYKHPYTRVIERKPPAYDEQTQRWVSRIYQEAEGEDLRLVPPGPALTARPGVGTKYVTYEVPELGKIPHTLRPWQAILETYLEALALNNQEVGR